MTRNEQIVAAITLDGLNYRDAVRRTDRLATYTDKRPVRIIRYTHTALIMSDDLFPYELDQVPLCDLAGVIKRYRYSVSK